MNNNTKSLRLRGGVLSTNGKGGHKRSRKHGKVGSCHTSQRRHDKIIADIASAKGPHTIFEE